MRRRLARPYGRTLPPTRIVSLLMGLAVLGLLYQRVKEPTFWRWLDNESRAESSDVSKSASPKDALPTPHSPLPTSETIVPGPNETDADELAKLRTNFKVIQDRQPLESFEMSAYWRLMAWSRTRPFADLEKLARRDVPYQHLWDEPELYRGQPIRLKLHVRRVYEYEAKANPYDVKKVYEIYGWTDDSLSFPFIVVVPEKPAGLPIGTDVEGDIVFAGYFLKWMGYRAFDTTKSAPLLIGRAQPFARSGGRAKAGEWETAVLTIVGGVLLLSLIGWFAVYGLRRPRTIVAATTASPDQLPDNWLASSFTDLRSGTTGGNLDFANIGVPITGESAAHSPAAAPAAAPETTPTSVS